MLHPDLDNAPSGAFLNHFPRPSVVTYEQPPLPHTETYIGVCCREWVMAFGYPPGRCGYCGERPQYAREDI